MENLTYVESFYGNELVSKKATYVTRSYICIIFQSKRNNNNDSDDHVWLILFIRFSLLSPLFVCTWKISKMGQWPKETYYNRWTISPIVFSDWGGGKKGEEDGCSRWNHGEGIHWLYEATMTGHRRAFGISLLLFVDSITSLALVQLCTGPRWLTRASISCLLKKLLPDGKKKK